MGTLGKVLLVVNLLAGVGLTYLAAQDWQKRQEVAARALQHHVALKGLPVEGNSVADADEVPFAVELTGGVTSGPVRKSFLVNYFQGADGGGNFGDPTPPVSQLAELARVKAKVKAVVAGFGTPAEKLAYLCGSLNGANFTPGLLARLATSYEERSEFVALATRPGDKDADAKTAEAALDRRFESAETIKPDQADVGRIKELAEATKKAAADAKAAFEAWQRDVQNKPAEALAQSTAESLKVAQAAQAKALVEFGGSAARDAGDRRRKVASLLGELDPSAGWQKRVALVVGLRAYRESVGERVDRLRDFTRSAQAQAVADQAEFTETYLLLKQQAAARTLILQQQQLLTADLVAQQAQEREATSLRRGQFVTRQKDLDAILKEVADALAKQTEVEAELFGLQKRVGDALRGNFDLEDKLKRAEYKTAGAQ